ncbi:rhombosortase [Gallaecimonas sp. GXIMD4217]|uniref:rhombosortase n=1 Tax=Gallaecimonas sp. GXIMD4217 TaxID=3131927 RepID=UPI00311B4023
MRRLYGPLSIAMVAILAAILPESGQSLLVYERSSLESLELWRLLTGHLLHTNGWHLLLNLGGLGLIAWLHGSYYNPLGWWLRLGYLALVISVGLYLWLPDLSWYVGLSGALHGLLLMGAAEDIKRGEQTGWWLLGGVIAKVFWEQLAGGSAQVTALIDARVVTEAHLLGVLAALPWVATRRGA